MVSEVVLAKACRIRETNWEIGEDGKQTIVKRCAKGEIMADFVDGKKEVLVGSGSNNVGSQEKWPRQNRGVLEQCSTCNLEQDHQNDSVDGQRFRPTQLQNLLVCFDDGLTSSAVRLFSVGPEELVFG